MKLLPKLMLLALPVTLAACGGGGGGDNKTCSSDLYNLTKSCTANASTAIPEGIWFGAVSSNAFSESAQTVVLENGQYFTIISQSGNYQWMIEGNMTATNGTFTDSTTVGFHTSGALRGGNLTGTFTAKSTFSATTGLFVTPDTTPTSFNGTYNTTYDTPIALSDVARTWTSASGNTPVSSITIGADGTANGTQGVCTFSGSFKPRSTGKHILDGTLAFSGSVCSLAGQSLSVEATTVNNQLTIFGVTAQRDAAFFLSGQ
jgi:hypothetical protein